MSQIKQGFSLVELLIVVLIIGILASVAIPTYARTVEQSKRLEALVHLDNIRKSELRYYQLYGTYTTDSSVLDFDLPPVQYFEFWINLGNATQFRCQAARTNYKLPGTIPRYVLQIDQNGSISEWNI